MLSVDNEAIQSKRKGLVSGSRRGWFWGRWRSWFLGSGGDGFWGRWRGWFLGEPPYFPIGKEPPLNPPLSGGQKLSPFGRVRPERGRFVAVVPLIRGIPRRGEGVAFRGATLLPYREGTPLNPPLSGGQKLSPFGRVRPERGRFVAVVPLTRGSPPTSLSGRTPPLDPPLSGGGNSPPPPTQALAIKSK